jgi:hypothetical protein
MAGRRASAILAFAREHSLLSLATMKDNELRGLLLREYYNKRDLGWFQWAGTDFDPAPIGFSTSEQFLRICDQLGEHGLIDWKPFSGGSGNTVGGIGRISASGVDVIEGNRQSPIAIALDQSRHISVTQSNHVQIGDGNVQDVSIHVAGLVEAIENSSGSEEEKRQAKSLLKRFLEHPLVTAIGGGLASSIIKP